MCVREEMASSYIKPFLYAHRTEKNRVYYPSKKTNNNNSILSTMAGCQKMQMPISAGHTIWLFLQATAVNPATANENITQASAKTERWRDMIANTRTGHAWHLTTAALRYRNKYAYIYIRRVVGQLSYQLSCIWMLCCLHSCCREIRRCLCPLRCRMFHHLVHQTSTYEKSMYCRRASTVQMLTGIHSRRRTCKDRSNCLCLCLYNGRMLLFAM